MKKPDKSYFLGSIIVLAIVVFLLLINIIGNQHDSYYNLSPTETDEINEIIAGMSIDEKIGQLIIGGYDNLSDITAVISKYKLGGVILYKKNINTDGQTISDINSLNAANEVNKIPLFIATDQEGGRVSRLPNEDGSFEGALSIGDRNDSSYAFESGTKTGEALRKLKFNLDFAPVLDIFSNPNNTVIADRAYGTTPDRVSSMATQVIDGLHSKNIIATGKHFPGHGDTDVDSHVGLPLVNKSLDELNDFEFKPFVEAINHNIDMIMIAHIILSKVDDLPSSLSSKVVTDILRGQLKYNGVVITDDITMGAISKNYTLENAAVKAVQAGCDIVLVAKEPSNAVLVFNAIKQAVSEGKITDDRINESLVRILSLKYKYNLID